MRPLSLVVVAAWLCLAQGALAQESPTPQPPAADTQPDAGQPDDAQPADAQPATAPSGPLLQPSDAAPTACDPASTGFRFVEVRGTGFNAWATQRLVGSVIDANGVPRAQWGSVWVSPAGQLTLEVNLCADPFRNRGALPAGTYTVAVGSGNGAALAATSIALTPPVVVGATGDETAEDAAPVAVVATPATPTATPFTYIAPSAISLPTPTPLPPVTLPGTSVSSAPPPTPGPRTGQGSLGQPYPLGAPGVLNDGWQLVVQGVNPDAYTGIKASVPSTNVPAPDQRDYVVRVQATYLGQSTGLFSGMRLALLSTTTQTVYDQIHASCGTVPDMVPPNLVTPGGSTRGNVCFMVRASDVDSLVLFDSQSTDADRLYFSLK